jgi:hypothetical protein
LGCIWEDARDGKELGKRRHDRLNRAWQGSEEAVVRTRKRAGEETSYRDMIGGTGRGTAARRPWGGPGRGSRRRLRNATSYGRVIIMTIIWVLGLDVEPDRLGHLKRT